VRYCNSSCNFVYSTYFVILLILCVILIDCILFVSYRILIVFVVDVEP